MAGDWIKVEITTPDKPEVFEMAEALNLPPDEVLGKLIRVWIWADQHTRDGNAPSVTKALLDRYAAVTGFAAAMISVGWLLESGGRIQFPHFDRHNGKTAKTRALGAKRTQSHRSGNASVTQPPLQDRDSGVTDSLPEKRREEKRDLEQQPGQPLRLKVQNPNLRIPAAVNMPSIWEAITLWASHLDQMTAPHTLWQENSPQLAALLHQAHEWGEKRFLAAMQWSMANGRYILAEAFDAKPNGKPGRGRKPDPGADEVWLHVCEVLSSTGDGPDGNALRDRLLTPEQREAAKRARTRSRLEGCKCEKDRNDIAASFLEMLKIVTFERQGCSTELEAAGKF